MFNFIRNFQLKIRFSCQLCLLLMDCYVRISDYSEHKTIKENELETAPSPAYK